MISLRIKTLLVTSKEIGLEVNSGKNKNVYVYGPGSSVGIATDYGLDGPEIESWLGEIFRPSRPTLGPTQPPVH
jgi:hypothetical protein